MKHIYMSVFSLFFVSVLAVEVEAQQSSRAQSLTDSISLAADSSGVEMVKGASEKINVAFRKINTKDAVQPVAVYNPKENIGVDYRYSSYDGLTGNLSGLVSNGNIWGLGSALILVDGIERDFGSILWDEVEQVTVLKGVNAVALYGSQGAKGVILITSKRGTAGVKQVNTRVNQSISSPKLFPKYLKSADYMTLYNEARVNDGQEVAYDEQTIENFRSGDKYRFPDLDYYSSDYLRKFQLTTNATAEFIGGNETARFYSSVGLAKGNSLLNVGEGQKEGSTRFSVRGNIDVNINKYVSSTVDASVYIYNNHSGLGDYWNAASTLQPHRYSPLLPISTIEQTGNAEWIEKANASRNIIDGNYLLGGTQETMSNPFAGLYAGGYTESIYRVLQVANGIDFDMSPLIEGLSAHTTFSMDYNNWYNQFINNEYAVYNLGWNKDEATGLDTIAALNKYGNDEKNLTQNVGGTAQRRNVSFRFHVDYVRSWSNTHNLNVMLMGYTNNRQTNGVLQGTTFSNLGLQVAYNYNHKYLLDVTTAYVSSTKLSKDNRTALSPTFALGWVLSQESFLENVAAVDYLKLSLAGGVVNTDLDIDGYYYDQNVWGKGNWFSWSDGKYSSSNQASVSLQGGNSNLGFIQRKELSLGLEGVFFNKQLAVNANVFSTTMDGLVVRPFTQYPSYYGSFAPYMNNNANTYKGFDLAINLHKKFGDLAIDLGSNLVYYTTEVTKRDELFSDSYQNRVGNPTDAMYGLQSAGFFEDAQDIANSPTQLFGVVRPGDIKYVDQNNDGIVDDRDEVKIGQWGSPLNFSVNFTATYKGFSLYLQGLARSGGNAIKSGNYFWVDGDDKYSEEVLGRWTEETKSTANYPRLSSESNSNNYRFSDFWMYSTNRFSLNRVQLTYNLSERVLSKSFLKGLQVYVGGRDLLTISKNRDILDLNIGSSPQFRHFDFGVSAKF